jgi:hypothetical protein
MPRINLYLIIFLCFALEAAAAPKVVSVNLLKERKISLSTDVSQAANLQNLESGLTFLSYNQESGFELKLHQQRSVLVSCDSKLKVNGVFSKILLDRPRVLTQSCVPLHGNPMFIGHVRADDTVIWKRALSEDASETSWTLLGVSKIAIVLQNNKTRQIDLLSPETGQVILSSAAKRLARYSLAQWDPITEKLIAVRQDVVSKLLLVNEVDLSNCAEKEFASLRLRNTLLIATPWNPSSLVFDPEQRLLIMDRRLSDRIRSKLEWVVFDLTAGRLIYEEKLAKFGDVAFLLGPSGKLGMFITKTYATIDQKPTELTLREYQL